MDYFEPLRPSLKYYSSLDDKLLFEWLVRYHCDINLGRWLEHAKINNAGYKLIPKAGFNLREGIDENKFTKGALMMASSGDVIDRLVSDRIIVDEGLTDQSIIWKPVETYKHLLNYFENIETNDISYVIDKERPRITTIHEFNNSKRLEKSFLHYIPIDFLSFKEKIDIMGTGATKTKNAIRAAVYYDNVSMFQIKSTAYANSGIGKVAYFDKKGLVKEFFLLYHPSSIGPFINKEWGIIGVIRKYRDNKGEPVYDNDRIIPASISVVDEDLKIDRQVDVEYIKRTIVGR